MQEEFRLPEFLWVAQNSKVRSLIEGKDKFQDINLEHLSKFSLIGEGMRVDVNKRGFISINEVPYFIHINNKLIVPNTFNLIHYKTGLLYSNGYNNPTSSYNIGYKCVVDKSHLKVIVHIPTHNLTPHLHIKLSTELNNKLSIIKGSTKLFEQVIIKPSMEWMVVA